MLHRHRGRCDGLSGERVKPGAFLFMYQRLNVAHPASWMCRPARHQAVGRKKALFDGVPCSSAPASSHLAFNHDTNSLFEVLFEGFWRPGFPILDTPGHTQCVPVHGILFGVSLSHGNIVIPVIFAGTMGPGMDFGRTPGGRAKMQYCSYLYQKVHVGTIRRGRTIKKAIFSQKWRPKFFLGNLYYFWYTFTDFGILAFFAPN